MSDSLHEDIDYLRDDMRYVLGELQDLQHDLNAVIARIDALEQRIPLTDTREVGDILDILEA